MKIEGKVIALAVSIYGANFLACLVIGLLLSIGLRGPGTAYFVIYSPLVGLMLGFPSLAYVVWKRRASCSLREAMFFGFVSGLLLSIGIHGMLLQDARFNPISVLILAFIFSIPISVLVKLVAESVNLMGL